MSFTGNFSLLKSSKPLIDSSFFIKEPLEIYYSKRNEYLTITDLKKLMEFPPGTTDPVSDKDRAEKFLIERASHVLILEGKDIFDNKFTTKKSEGDHREFLTESQYKTVTNLKNAVQINPTSRVLLQEGIAEGVVRAKYKNLFCQIRMDWFNPYYGLVDFKTTDSIEQFDREINAFRYYERLSFFRVVLREATGVTVPVIFMIVSKKEMKCEVRPIQSSYLDIKENEIQRYLYSSPFKFSTISAD